MRHFLIALFIALMALPASAGGVVIYDESEEPAVVQDRKNALPIILLGLAVAAIVLSSDGGGGSVNCVEPEPEPDPC